MADFRVAIQREVDEFRAEVRSIEKLDEIERLEEVARQAAALHYPGPVIPNTGPKTAIPKPIEESDDEVGMPMVVPFPSYADEEEKERHDAPPGPIPPIPRMGLSRTVSELPPRRRVQSSDPFSTYVRKTSLLSSQAPLAAQPAIFYASFFEPPKAAGDTASAAGATTTAVSGIEAAGGIVDEPSTFRVPTRSRGGSTDGGVMGPLLRQLSTVSISDTVPMQKMAAVVDGGAEITAADAPASSLPVEFQAHKRESGTSNPE